MKFKQDLSPVAYPCNDPKSIAQLLQDIQPKGKHRNKIAQLLKELKTLDMTTHPQAFCLLLRSILELSAKAYCLEHDIQIHKDNGREKPLVDILYEVVVHIEVHNAHYAHLKLLHGTFVELRRKDGFLSIPSLNQVVHNLYFSIAVGDICMYFNNIFPLLEAMN